MRQLHNQLMIISLALTLGSCVKHRELINFNQGPAFPNGPASMITAPPIVIQPDDLLSVQVFVSGLDPTQAVAPFNLGGSSENRQNDNAGAGYLVDPNGNINYPGLGTLHLQGLTIGGARDTIAARLKAYLKDPIVSIRFLNFKYTILGEVQSPNTYSVNSERLTILEAVGSAGDLTEYANRTNILVIREQNGQREFGRLNLQDRGIFMSPYFYLRPNDVIYVEPIPARVGTVSDKFNRVLPYISAGITVVNLIIIISRLNGN